MPKLLIVGTHGIPQLTPYKPSFDNLVSNIRLGSDLRDMDINRDNDECALLDNSRKIIIIQGCVTAKVVSSRRIFIFKAEDVHSILLDSYLYLLRPFLLISRSYVQLH